MIDTIFSYIYDAIYKVLFVTQYGIFNMCEYLLDVIIYRVLYMYVYINSIFFSCQTVGPERLEIWDTGVTQDQK